VRAKVELQNRSPGAEVIADAKALAKLVTLSAESLGPCSPPLVALRSSRPQAKLPATLRPRQKMNVFFDVTFDCANDPAKTTPKNPGHDDDRLSALVDQAALGGVDAHSVDDACPRQVSAPGVVDPFPDGTILDRGCGARRPDKTFGDPVLVDVVVMP
jgi:hypothetical protein